MSVQLALYKGRGTLFNALIRWWTRSPYSHCELVINGTCYSSSIRDGGVRGGGGAQSSATTGHAGNGGVGGGGGGTSGTGSSAGTGGAAGVVIFW